MVSYIFCEKKQITRGCNSRCENFCLQNLYKVNCSVRVGSMEPSSILFKKQVEKIQRYPVRFISSRYRRKESVTQMFHSSGLHFLEMRWQKNHLKLLFQILNDHLNISEEVYLPPPGKQSSRSNSKSTGFIPIGSDTAFLTQLKCAMNCWCVLLNRPTCQNLNRSWICTNVPLDLDVTCICVFANGVLFFTLLLCYPLCKDSRKRVDSIAK